MNKKRYSDAGLFLLALVFSIGLMFAFIELPQLLDQFLQKVIHTPQSDPVYDAAKIELFYNAYAIRLVGFLCLGIIFLLIIVGFATRKTGLAWLGGLVLFLPVFATFAQSMFYLAGLGIFNVILFPFLDLSLAMANLGSVVLLPYWILVWFFDLFHWNAHTALVYFFMISGSLLFVLGVFTWLKTRFSKGKVAVSWLYRYSRHPQYLGWIIWSYGLMLYGPSVNEMKKSWGWNGTLPWLLSTMVIIGICMLEELKMKEKAGNEYESYRDRTPFLFPIPRFLKRIFRAPMKLFFKKERPERRREVGTVLGFYTLILVGISLIWVELPGKTDQDASLSIPYDPARVKVLLSEIQKEQARRDRSMAPYDELLAMGSKTYPIIIQLIGDKNPDVRDFAMGAAAGNQVIDAVPAIINALHDSIDRNKRSAIRALGMLHDTSTVDTLLYFFKNNIEGYPQHDLLNSLSALGCMEIIPALVRNLENAPWYSWAQNIRNLAQLDKTMTSKYIYLGLENPDPLIRREAVYFLLEDLPPDAIPHLEKVINDESWEVRFYARQAIRLIKGEKNEA